MMDMLTASPMNFLVFSNVLLLCAAALALLRFERRLREFAASREERDGRAPPDGSGQQAVLAGFLERRLAIMHQRLNELSARLDEGLAPPPAPSEPHLFGHAVRMARNGAGADALVRVCGLSRAEAALVARLHGRRGAPSDEVAATC